MLFDHELIIVWIAVSVLAVALVGVTIARLTNRKGAGRLSCWLAVACLVVVGAASIASMEACGRCWLVFATTLPLMAVGATLDFRKTGPSAAF